MPNDLPSSQRRTKEGAGSNRPSQAEKVDEIYESAKANIRKNTKVKLKPPKKAGDK